MKQADKKNIFKKGSTTYYYSSWFFPPAVKKDIYTLYAFVRTADDFVDQVPASKSAFKRLVEDTWKAWNGKKIDDEIVADFVRLAQKKKIQKAWIKAFLDSMASDLSKKRYRTEQELDRYMYGSAEVIGLMMACILDLPTSAHKTARLQGKAMQLLNFIRDVAEDRDLGRTYIPESVLRKYGLNRGEWGTAQWSQVLQDQLKRYQRLQMQASQGYKYLPRQYRLPIVTAAKMYEWTGQKIAANPEIVWRQKVKPHKLQILVTFMKQLMKP